MRRRPPPRRGDEGQVWPALGAPVAVSLAGFGAATFALARRDVGR
jgi:hypothetical protein